MHLLECVIMLGILCNWLTTSFANFCHLNVLSSNYQSVIQVNQRLRYPLHRPPIAQPSATRKYICTPSFASDFLSYCCASRIRSLVTSYRWMVVIYEIFCRLIDDKILSITPFLFPISKREEKSLIYFLLIGEFLAPKLNGFPSHALPSELLLMNLNV